MKLKLLLLVVAILTSTTMQADPSGFIVPLTKVVKTTPHNGGNPRSPILVPVLYIDGYTLTASDNTIGSTIQLLGEDDNVVFSTYVAVEGDIQLPTTLSGTYTIRVICDDAIFEGEIEL
jgi:hypothetical protein